MNITRLDTKIRRRIIRIIRIKLWAALEELKFFLLLNWARADEFTLRLMETYELHHRCSQLFPSRPDTLLCLLCFGSIKSARHSTSHRHAPPPILIAAGVADEQSVTVALNASAAAIHQPPSRTSERGWVTHRRMNNVFLFDWKQLLYSRCHVCTTGQQRCSILLLI